MHTEESVLSHVRVLEKDMDVQASRLLTPGTRCFLWNWKISHKFSPWWFGRVLPSHSFLCVFPVSLALLLPPSLYLLVYFGPPLSTSFSMSPSLCPLPPYSLFFSLCWMASLTVFHPQLAQNIVLNIMIWCWPKYRYLLTLP